jgi:hypothetical protein
MVPPRRFEQTHDSRDYQCISALHETMYDSALIPHIESVEGLANKYDQSHGDETCFLHNRHITSSRDDQYFHIKFRIQVNSPPPDHQD